MSEGSGFLLSQDGFRYIRGLLTLLLNIILAATCDARGCGDPSLAIVCGWNSITQLHVIASRSTSWPRKRGRPLRGNSAQFFFSLGFRKIKKI